jgi:hypothetical protein
MPGIRPVCVGKRVEHRRVCGANGVRALASLTVSVRTGGRFEHTVVGHHRHQRVEIVPVPGVSEAVQQRHEVGVGAGKTLIATGQVGLVSMA